MEKRRKLKIYAEKLPGMLLKIYLTYQISFFVGKALYWPNILYCKLIVNCNTEQNKKIFVMPLPLTKLRSLNSVSISGLGKTLDGSYAAFT